MPITRQIKVTTKQEILKDEPKVQNFPTRRWSIEVTMLHAETGAEMPATVFDKVTYKLHPTFEVPIRSKYYSRNHFALLSTGLFVG